jgi:hypothetical protein
MNIKLVKINDRWLVIVSSINGQFQEDVTSSIHDAMLSEVWEKAQREADAQLKIKVTEMQEAIDSCVSALQPYID